MRGGDVGDGWVPVESFFIDKSRANVARDDRLFMNIWHVENVAQIFFSEEGGQYWIRQ